MTNIAKRTQILTALRCARRSASASSARHASLGNFASFFFLGQIWHRLSPATIHCTLARVFYFRARRPANKSTNRVKRWSTVATHYGGFGDNRLLHFYTITVSLKVFRSGWNLLYQLSDWLIDHWLFDIRHPFLPICHCVQDAGMVPFPLSPFLPRSFALLSPNFYSCSPVFLIVIINIWKYVANYCAVVRVQTNPLARLLLSCNIKNAL